ncbi:MAG: YidC/Oxa1 family membrane protein insertase [Actinomycetia bacterium]|nr:YidC/Oxa1 family membrane protein insertase [Actinomycetes bacterium]MCP4960818.1 YidC/Oxa1 family membrane protein insertase [Actinomycetes bacterium]
MFDPIFKGIATLLAFCYSFTTNYALAIAVFTLIIMVAFTPLTLKSTRSMMAMQRLQPQIKQLQSRHKDDRQTLNTEMMALYQAEGVNPLGGCLPMLVQMPVFIILFQVLRGLTRNSAGLAEGVVEFDPKYLDQGTQLYKDLSGESEMLAFGIDLARQANEVVQDDILKSIPFVIMVAITALTSWYQQRQMAARRSGEMPAQQQAIMKIMPWMLPVFAFFMPAGLVVYFIVSNLYRVGQQAYIHHKMPSPSDEDSLVEIDEADVKPRKAPAKDTGQKPKRTDARAASTRSKREGTPNRPRPQPRPKSRASSPAPSKDPKKRPSGSRGKPAPDKTSKPRPTSRTGGNDGMNRSSNKKKRKR